MAYSKCGGLVSFGHEALEPEIDDDIGSYVCIDDTGAPNATRVGFTNTSGAPDETEFDTTDESELAELWWEFCKENGIVTLTRIRLKE